MFTAPFPADRLTRLQAAEYLGLRPATLEADAVHGRLRIPFYRVGARTFYRRSELERWLQTRAVNALPRSAEDTRTATFPTTSVEAGQLHSTDGEGA